MEIISNEEIQYLKTEYEQSLGNQNEEQEFLSESSTVHRGEPARGAKCTYERNLPNAIDIPSEVSMKTEFPNEIPETAKKLVNEMISNALNEVNELARQKDGKDQCCDESKKINIERRTKTNTYEVTNNENIYPQVTAKEIEDIDDQIRDSAKKIVTQAILNAFVDIIITDALNEVNDEFAEEKLGSVDQYRNEITSSKDTCSGWPNTFEVHASRTEGSSVQVLSAPYPPEPEQPCFGCKEIKHIFPVEQEDKHHPTSLMEKTVEFDVSNPVDNVEETRKKEVEKTEVFTHKSIEEDTEDSKKEQRTDYPQQTNKKKSSNESEKNNKSGKKAVKNKKSRNFRQRFFSVFCCCWGNKE